jgi:hypothetical protein
MKFKIEWTVLLNCKNEVKANKLLKRLEQATNLHIQNKKFEQYWKDKSLIKTDFRTLYANEMNVEEAIFITLQIVNNVGTMWSVYSPQNFTNNETEESVWSFEGICDSPKITGIDWVQIVMSTNTELEYGWSH